MSNSSDAAASRHGVYCPSVADLVTFPGPTRQIQVEAAFARTILEKLLKTCLGGGVGSPVFKSWPSRDRHQLWAAMWLALRFVPDRPYSQAEVAWMLAHHSGDPSPGLLMAMQVRACAARSLQWLTRGSRREGGGARCPRAVGSFQTPANGRSSGC